MNDPFDPYSSEGMFGSAIESDEQRRERERREAEQRRIAGNTEVSTQKLTQYQDGSSTRTTTQELPAAAQPGLLDRVGQNITQAGSNFVNNVKAIPGQVMAAVNPANYNTYIQKQESGSNPNIGYHYPADAQGRRKSTAYGAYGITAPAYQDIQKANPQFASRPIESLSVEEQGQANQTYRQVLSQQLTALGIEPTEANIRGAQFSGAAGLARNLQTGQASAASAAANGGQDKFNQILQQRMAGQPAPASAAAAPASAAAEQQRLAQLQQSMPPGGRGPGGSSVNIGATPSWAQMGANPADFAKTIGIPPSAAPVAQPPPSAAPVAQPPPAAPADPSTYSLATGMPSQGLGTAQQRMASTMPAPPDATSQAISRYQAIQTDPNQLMKFAFDPATPAYLQTRAKDQIVEQYDQQKKLKQAEADLKTATPAVVAGAMSRRTRDGKEPTAGDWLQYLVLSTMPAFADLAAEKGEALGIGKKWTQSTITDEKGNVIPVELQTTASGRTLGGVLRGTDIPLTKEQMAQTGGALGKGTSVSAEVYVDNKTGNRYRSGVDSAGNAALINIQGGAAFRANPKDLEVQSIGTTAAKMDLKYLSGLKEKFGSDVIGGYTQFVKDNPTATTEEKQQMAQMLGLNPEALKAVGLAPAVGQTPPPAAAPQPAAAAAPPAAAPQPAAAGTGPVPPVALPPAAPAAGQTPPPAGGKVAAGSPAAAAAAGVNVPPMPRRTPGMGEAEYKAKMAAWNTAVAEANRVAAGIAEEAGKSPIRVAEDQQKRYNEYIEKDVQPKADAGKQIGRVRKEQINGPDGILKNPEIVGMLQGGSGSEVGNILRDLITGAVGPTDLTTRVAALNLNDTQKRVLYAQIGLNNQILPLTLKANAGPGAISEAEHKINREANVDITRQPLHSALSLMTRDQFIKDLSVARNDFRSGRQDIRTTDQLNKEWDIQERKANQAYDQIYAARAAYIAKYNPLDKNGKQTNPGAVVDAFTHYPVPTWSGTSWDYGTEFAKKAARPPLSSFK